jgi:hypothetical protein
MFVFICAIAQQHGQVPHLAQQIFGSSGVAKTRLSKSRQGGAQKRMGDTCGVDFLGTDSRKAARSCRVLSSLSAPPSASTFVSRRDCPWEMPCSCFWGIAANCQKEAYFISRTKPRTSMFK